MISFRGEKSKHITEACTFSREALRRTLAVQRGAVTASAGAAGLLGSYPLVALCAAASLPAAIIQSFLRAVDVSSLYFAEREQAAAGTTDYYRILKPMGTVLTKEEADTAAAREIDFLLEVGARK